MATPRLAFVALAIGAGSLVACAEVSEESSPDSAGTHTLALTYDTLADTDVGGFQFTATEVDCATGLPIVPASVVTATEDLEDMYLPGAGSIV